VVSPRGDTRHRKWALKQHTGAVTALAWQPERQWLASGSADTDVIVWDLHCQGRPPATAKPQALRLQGHTGGVKGLCFLHSPWLQARPETVEPVRESRCWLVSVSDGPRQPAALRRPQHPPTEIEFLWRLCMGALVA
jgi:WD40 repeat protein